MTTQRELLHSLLTAAGAAPRPGEREVGHLAQALGEPEGLAIEVQTLDLWRNFADAQVLDHPLALLQILGGGRVRERLRVDRRADAGLLAGRQARPLQPVLEAPEVEPHGALALAGAWVRRPDAGLPIGVCVLAKQLLQRRQQAVDVLVRVPRLVDADLAQRQGSLWAGWEAGEVGSRASLGRAARRTPPRI